MKNMTYCPKIWDTKTCTEISLEQIIERIKSGSEGIKEIKTKLENTTDPDQKKTLKNSLPVFMASGVFTQRKSSKIKIYSRYIIIDLDYKNDDEQRQIDWENLKALPFVRLMFSSPNNGIKALVRHNNDNPALHKELFAQVCAKLNCSKIDKSGSDLARACFFSYDPDLYDNTTCQIFNFTPSENYKPQTKVNAKIITNSLPSILSPKQEQAVIEKIQAWSEIYFPISYGKRNSNTFKFAFLLRQEGVSKQAATEYLVLKYIGTDKAKGDDFTGEEIVNIVENAYL